MVDVVTVLFVRIGKTESTSVTWEGKMEETGQRFYHVCLHILCTYRMRNSIETQLGNRGKGQE